MITPEKFPESENEIRIKWIITHARYTNQKAVLTQNDL